MHNINKIQDVVIEDFSMFDDWMGKYEHLIEFGKALPLIDPQYKTEMYLVRGCQSKVWLNSSIENGKIIFKADSDAIITKGLVGLLLKVLSNHSPEEIVNADLYFIKKIGLHEHLSLTRSNGLVAMIKQMKRDALAYQIKNS